MELEDADRIIRSAIAEYQPHKVFALFSGGHDSLAATHIAMRYAEVHAVVHVATGTGIPETFAYVEETCKSHGWPLLVYRPPLDNPPGQPGDTYRAWVLAQGFPGPAIHHIAYRKLKERALDQLMREHKVAHMDRIMFITGAREQESERRMSNSQEMRKVSSRVWCNPIVHWSFAERDDYIATHGLKRNEVSDLLHMSGECLCGCFSKPGELADIRLWFPQVAERIEALQKEAEDRGVHCRWGKREPKSYQLKRAGQMELPLCWSCAKLATPDV